MNINKLAVKIIVYPQEKFTVQNTCTYVDFYRGFVNIQNVNNLLLAEVQLAARCRDRNLSSSWIIEMQFAFLLLK